MKIQKLLINSGVMGFVFISMIDQSFAQIKLWDSSSRKSIKTQGVFCTLESGPMPNIIPKNEERHELIQVEPNFVGAATTSAGPVASALYTGLVQFTTRDEKQYSSKIKAINSLSMKSDRLNGFLASSYYVNRKNGNKEMLFSYEFIPKVEDDSLLTFTMKTVEENYSPVRLERKHQFVTSSAELTVKAVVREDVDNKGTFVVKTMELGKLNFTELSVGNKSLDAGNQTNLKNQLILPKTNKEGGQIMILEYVFNYEISHNNPVGTTQRRLNKVLKNQSDNSAALIEALAELLKTESER